MVYLICERLARVSPDAMTIKNVYFSSSVILSKSINCKRTCPNFMRYKKDHPTKQIIAADLLCFPLSRKLPISASLVNIIKCGLVECHNEKVFANFPKQGSRSSE